MIDPATLEIIKPFIIACPGVNIAIVLKEYRTNVCLLLSQLNLVDESKNGPVLDRTLLRAVISYILTDSDDITTEFVEAKYPNAFVVMACFHVLNFPESHCVSRLRKDVNNSIDRILESGHPAEDKIILVKKLRASK